MHPLLILALGIALVLTLIVALRVNAFLALIISALFVSLCAPLAEGQAMGVKLTRVLEAMGTMAGKIGVLIASAAIVGECMMLSGAADRIVRFFLKIMGAKRGDVALTASGYVLSVPVFFDTVFYLMSPLARSMTRRTGGNYLLFIMAVVAGGAATHNFVPPTPGPLATAAALNVRVDMMILVGGMVAIPATIAGLCYAHWLNRVMPIAMRQPSGEVAEETQPLEDHELPPLFASFLPIILPVLLISLDTIAGANAKAVGATTFWKETAGWTSFFGNPNFALLVAAGVSILIYQFNRKPGSDKVRSTIEKGLMAAGVIILITSAGAAFGDMLKAAGVGPAIENLFKGEGETLPGVTLLFICFGMCSIFKIAQGSSTVAMITTASMAAALFKPETLGFHPAYIATAIASGALCISWMNDSGFWIYTKMSGLTEAEGLKSWSVLLLVLGVVGFIMTLILSQVLPMAITAG